MPIKRRAGGSRNDSTPRSEAVLTGLPTDLPHVLARRWYLALTGLLITVAMFSAVIILMPVKYNARADVLLTPHISGRNDNPLLGLGGLEDVPVAIARSALNPAAVDLLTKHGITSGYSIAPDPTNPAPLLVLQATGTTRAKALNAMKFLYTLVPATLKTLQQGVAPRARITASLLVQADATTPITRTRTRALLAVTAAGLALTGLLTTATDRLLLARRRKHPNTDTDTTTDEDTTTDSAADDTDEVPPRPAARPVAIKRVEPAARWQPAALPGPTVPQGAAVRETRPARPRPAPADGHPSSASAVNRPKPGSARGPYHPLVDPNSNIRLFPVRSDPGRHARE